MNGKGVVVVIGALLMLLLTIVVFAIVYAFIVSYVDETTKRISEVKPVSVVAERGSDGKLYFVLLSKGGAESVRDCKLDDSYSCGSFGDVGSRINCGSVPVGTHTLACTIDETRTAVWMGKI